METKGIRTKENHKHWPKTKTLRPFAGCVGSATTDCHPEAHGGVSYRENCPCGAERTVNVNQFYRENGAWYWPGKEQAGIKVEMNPFGEIVVRDNGMIQMVISQQEAERLAQGILDLLQDEGQWK